MPARKTKAGAQKCVTHRVKKSAGVRPPAGMPEKTRTWSRAMSTMTTPRRMSREAMRGFGLPVEDEPLWRAAMTHLPRNARILRRVD